MSANPTKNATPARTRSTARLENPKRELFDLIGIDSYGQRTVLERGLSADAVYVARTEKHAWDGWYVLDTVPAGVRR